MTSTGLLRSSFRLSSDLQSRFVGLFRPLPDGSIGKTEDYLPLDIKYESGGAGLFGNASDFAQLLQALLNHGEHPGVRRRSQLSTALPRGSGEHGLSRHGRPVLAPRPRGQRGHCDPAGYRQAVWPRRGDQPRRTASRPGSKQLLVVRRSWNGVSCGPREGCRYCYAQRGGTKRRSGDHEALCGLRAGTV